MRGQVTYISEQSGLIESEQYEFQFLIEEVVGAVELQVGDTVKYSLNGEIAERVKFLKASPDRDEEEGEL